MRRTGEHHERGKNEAKKADIDTGPGNAEELGISP